MANVVVAGDFCPKDRVVSLLDEERFFDVFGEIKPILEEADYSIVNLEAPIAPVNAKPINKIGPNLKCNNKVVGATKYAGFNCVTLANNHFYDYGEEGALNTIKELETNGIEYIGAGKNLEDAGKIRYKEIKGEVIALINCCEHEYSIATPTTAGTNPLDLTNQFYAIREAKIKADKVIVIVHGGIEHYQLPTPRMAKTYRFFIDAGADIVINHHQHCYSGYEVYNGHPIFYGLGNFCFDWAGKRESIWNEGFMIKIDTHNLQFEMIPYKQCNNIAKIELLSGDEKKAFNQSVNSLNEIISSTEQLEQKLSNFALLSRRGFNPFHPYTNPYMCALYGRGLLPSFVTRKKLLSIQNKIMCESHLERLSIILKNSI